MQEPVLCIAASELGAGTRGASQGPEQALSVALTDHAVWDGVLDPSQLFRSLQKKYIPSTQEALQQPSSSLHAKYIREIAAFCERTCAVIQNISTQGNVPFVLSGDHSTAAGIIGGLLQAAPTEKLGVIWIDAHPDLQTPYTSHSGHVHGMALAAALGEDNRAEQKNQPETAEIAAWTQLKSLSGQRLKAEDVVLVAARSIDPPERAFIQRKQMHVLSVAELRQKKHSNVAAITYKKIRAVLCKCTRIFVSFDVDSMDKALVPGTGTPVEEGLSFEEALGLNHNLIRVLTQEGRLCGWEMSELNPWLDKQGRTVKKAAHVLNTVLDAYMSSLPVQSSVKK